MRSMPKSRPTSAIAPGEPPWRPRKATLSTTRSARFWPRSSRLKGEACRFDPASAELHQDRLRRLSCELYTKLGQLGGSFDQRVEAGAGEPGIDLHRVGKRLDPEHVSRRARRHIDSRNRET